MKLDLTGMKVSLVICPYDLRAGLGRLASAAQNYFSIDIFKGEDCVVFVSKQRCLCKIIYSDSKGSVLIIRRLHSGRFQRLLGKIDGPAVKDLTVSELMTYLDGESIEVERNHIFRG